MKTLVLVLLALAACDDHGSTPDALPASRFTCGDTSCDRVAEFCYTPLAGAAPANAGCNPMPASCQLTPNCACILDSAATPCGATTGCTVDGTAVTLTCGLP